ncbi:MAG: 3D domain-containing protein [Clostridia bacterium]|nr:3D domain-containing protein [Clostridia bacterium]
MLKIIKAVFNTRTLMLVLSVMLAATTINSYVYDNSVQVNIEIEGIPAKTISTEAGTVEEILEEGKFALGKGDITFPSANTKIMRNSTINLKRMKTVVIHDGEEKYSINTTASNTEELAMDASAYMGEFDSLVLYETGNSGAVIDGGSYAIKEAFQVNVYADCATYPVMVTDGTVAEAVRLSGVTVDADDLVTPQMTSLVYPGIEIKITRVSMVHETQTIAIPFEVEYRVNKNLAPGQEVVTVAGSEGQIVIDNVITYHDGVAVGYESNESVAKPAVNKVIECGVWNVRGNGQNSDPSVGTIGGYKYSKVIPAKATAYCDKGKTASGIQSKVGVVAVDPRVIPLGTRLYIEATDGSWSYGVCLAGDTGGAIKGNKVDLFYNTYNECIQFGRRDCNIYILCD